MLLPELKKIYNGNDIKIILLGKKTNDFEEKTKEILNDKIFINKGWVANPDLELQKGDIFLLCSNAYLNNQNSFIENTKINLSITQSRIAHVWSNKVCLVAHSENKRTTSDLKHLENCILGSDSKNLAKWIIKLKDNSRLRYKIANNGYKKYKNKFLFRNYSQLLDKQLNNLI